MQKTPIPQKRYRCFFVSVPAERRGPGWARAHRRTRPAGPLPRFPDLSGTCTVPKRGAARHLPPCNNAGRRREPGRPSAAGPFEAWRADMHKALTTETKRRAGMRRRLGARQTSEGGTSHRPQRARARGEPPPRPLLDHKGASWPPGIPVRRIHIGQVFDDVLFHVRLGQVDMADQVDPVSESMAIRA